MENQTGLADRARFEAFARQWRGAALKEAGKWCSDERAKQLLADAVLADFRTKYASHDLPLALEYFFRAQVCLVFGKTGQSVQKLEEYIAGHAFPEEPEMAGTTDEAPETPPSAPVEEPVKEAAPPTSGAAEPGDAPTGAAPAPEASAPAAPKDAPPLSTAPAPGASAPTAPVPVPAPEKPAEARPDTFLDPVRTAFWTPDSELGGHVIKEIELPDEEESERSVMISFLNTVLFILTAGAFAFCFYETGFLQYLLQ